MTFDVHAVLEENHYMDDWNQSMHRVMVEKEAEEKKRSYISDPRRPLSHRPCLRPMAPPNQPRPPPPHLIAPVFVATAGEGSGSKLFPPMSSGTAEAAAGTAATLTINTTAAGPVPNAQ